ncbi:gamma-glutamylcyclotransferase family protein [Cyclobacterium qasimii]|nr:gamma-glutamylcyclotransferase family protein [Cyclobacterium qasimii]
MSYLFVYGTLRKGFGHPMAELLERSGELFTSGTCKGLLYDLGPYPVFTYTSVLEEEVFGDVYLLHNEHEVLTILDEYEGVGEKLETGVTYERIKLDIESEDGVILSAWVYLHLGTLDHLTPIEGGDYLNYIIEGKGDQ